MNILKREGTKYSINFPIKPNFNIYQRTTPSMYIMNLGETSEIPKIESEIKIKTVGSGEVEWVCGVEWVVY